MLNVLPHHLLDVLLNRQAELDLQAFPNGVWERGKIQFGQTPILPIRYLDSVGQGVIELKKNGRPAYRCVYVTKYLDSVIVLHAFTKTTNGVDRQAMKVAEQRLKDLLAELRGN